MKEEPIQSLSDEELDSVAGGAEGVVKWYNAARGYGFISQDGADDLLITRDALSAAGIESVNEGTRISYDIDDSGKPCAINIKTLY